MTYWRAVKCLRGPRARELTTSDEIRRNYALVNGNMKVACAFMLITIIELCVLAII